MPTGWLQLKHIPFIMIIMIGGGSNHLDKQTPFGEVITLNDRENIMA
jgi:hypothetical protein